MNFAQKFDAMETVDQPQVLCLLKITTIVEKFPRYVVDAFCYFPLERLVDTLMQSANPKKYCVQFVKENGKDHNPFYFFQHFDHPSSTTWQIEQ